MGAFDQPGIQARAEALGLVARPSEWQEGYIWQEFGRNPEVRSHPKTGWHIHCPYHGFISGNVSEREAEVLLRGFEAGLRHAARMLVIRADTTPAMPTEAA